MEKETDKRIYDEYLRIGLFFEGTDETRFAMLLPLIRNAAFMRITLDDLTDIINETGAVEEYQNGENQHGMKQSAALQSYNALVKNYATIVKTLFGMLPYKAGLSKSEEWSRARMPADELKKVLSLERAEKKKTADEWLKKLKQAYGEIVGGETE